MPKRSIAATLSAAFGIAAAIAVAVGPALAHAVSPRLGFLVFGLGIAPFALTAIVSGLVGLVRTRSGSGRAGRARAWVGTGVGAALVLLVFALSPAGDVPRIHDVTTSPDDPPPFSEAVAKAPGRVNGVDYPDGGADVPRLQREAYPDLAPIELPVSPSEALERSRRAAEELGWTVSIVDPEAGAVEAYDVSRIFGFVDDVAIRVRPAGSGSLIDVRSNSRFGGSDLGANAARIRAFRDALVSTN